MYPERAVAWFGVGCYYACIGRHTDARRYFGKATTLDPGFAPAWLGFGHAFAAQDESDQARSLPLRCDCASSATYSLACFSCRVGMWAERCPVFWVHPRWCSRHAPVAPSPEWEPWPQRRGAMPLHM